MYDDSFKHEAGEVRDRFDEVAEAEREEDGTQHVEVIHEKDEEHKNQLEKTKKEYIPERKKDVGRIRLLTKLVVCVAAAHGDFAKECSELTAPIVVDLILQKLIDCPLPGRARADRIEGPESQSRNPRGSIPNNGS